MSVSQEAEEIMWRYDNFNQDTEGAYVSDEVKNNEEDKLFR